MSETLLLLVGCAANSPSLPVIAKQPEPTSPRASVSQIDPRSSQTWLLKVRS